MPPIDWVSRLPVEIQLHILRQCHSLNDLFRLVLASRQLHAAFVPNNVAIAEAVVANMIPEAVKPLAISAMICRQNVKNDNELLTADQNTLSSNLNAWIQRLSAAPLSSVALRDMVLHQRSIDELTEDLRLHSFAVARSQGYTVSDDEPDLSYEETVRIHGAFHLVDIFYCLRNTGLHRLDIMDMLLVDLPPWRLDELACVYDYLSMRLAFLSERCSELCLRGTDEYFRCATTTPSLPTRGIAHWIEPFFLRGIEACHTVIKYARDSNLDRRRFTEICEILDDTDRVSQARSLGLSSALNDKSAIYEEDNCAIDSSDRQTGPAGPNAAWKWRRHGVRYDWANLEDEDLAAWCSSVWDESRLKRWGVLDKPRDNKAAAAWSAQRSQRLDTERHERMAADESRPLPMPCRHGVIMPALPPRKGMLWCQADSIGTLTWSTCRECYKEYERSNVYKMHFAVLRNA